jgi:dihydrofolate reductase
MLISLLVAAAENNVIGKENRLPWHLPKDLKYFKNITWGMPVMMGRKTFESFNKPLSGRRNIVITRQPDWTRQGVVVVKSLTAALDASSDTDAKEVFVIGGGEIFREIFPDAGRIYMTRVHAEVSGDVFFPEIDPDKWKLEKSMHMSKDDRHAFDFSFEQWERVV